MYRVYIASRISKDNVFFPPKIILEDDCVTVKCPGLFSGRSTSITYDNVSHISILTPLVGFSSISFFAFGEEILIHGFTKAEADEIKRIISQNQRN